MKAWQRKARGFVATLLFAKGCDGGQQPSNVNAVTYGFNVLLGMPPAEQRSALIGTKLFTLTGNKGDVNGYIQYSQFSDMSTAERCVYKGMSNEIWWATSSSSLKTESKSSSHGVDASTTIGVKVPVGSAELGAETTVRNALVFGNSESSKEAITERTRGKTYSFDAKTRRRLYAVEVDYASLTSWTQEFKDACSGLGSSPSEAQVLNFFKEHGTHGLATAAFGQKCTSSVFMENGETLTTYYNFHSESSSFEAGLLWWTSSSSSSKSNEQRRSNKYGFSYTMADRRCDGEIATDSSCGGGMKGNGRDSPAITEWTYKPIWEMNVPTLGSGARQNLKSVFEKMMAASVKCMRTNCNDRGACAPKQSSWSNPSSIYNFVDFFDKNRCFCFNDYIGDKCESGRSVMLSNRKLNGYANDWDGSMNFSNGDPICGMYSYHSNSREDRRFKFRTCKIGEPEHERAYGSSQLTPWTWWDSSFNLICEANKVVTRIESYHSNGREDRRWRFTCQQFIDTRTDNCVGFPSAYANDMDQPVDYACPGGKVLTGMHSYHSNDNEDRRFKFMCCELLIQKTSETKSVKKSGWSAYKNNWDAYMSVTALKPSGDSAAFCGMSSYHSNSKEDRRYRFKFCWPDDSTYSNNDIQKFGWTDWDATFTINCSGNRVLRSLYSYHSNDKEDRRFYAYCYSFVGWETNQCRWTDAVNGYDQPYDFECGVQEVMTGIISWHNNDREDRRFRFKCCRWEKERLRDTAAAVNNATLPMLA